MPKVSEKPEITKTEHQEVICFSCNSVVDKKSPEVKSWFRFHFCNTECLDDFKRKFN
jgi:hypothetical protein